MGKRMSLDSVELAAERPCADDGAAEAALMSITGVNDQ
jgi:hypothetical protein